MRQAGKQMLADHAFMMAIRNMKDGDKCLILGITQSIELTAKVTPRDDTKYSGKQYTHCWVKEMFDRDVVSEVPQAFGDGKTWEG